jgi:hypothetical protein
VLIWVCAGSQEQVGFMLEKIDLGGPVFIDFIENEYATKVLRI